MDLPMAEMNEFEDNLEIDQEYDIESIIEDLNKKPKNAIKLLITSEFLSSRSMPSIVVFIT